MFNLPKDPTIEILLENEYYLIQVQDPNNKDIWVSTDSRSTNYPEIIVLLKSLKDQLTNNNFRIGKVKEVVTFKQLQFITKNADEKQTI